jgi:hypothetical protein
MRFSEKFREKNIEKFQNFEKIFNDDLLIRKNFFEIIINPFFDHSKVPIKHTHRSIENYVKRRVQASQKRENETNSF